MWRTNLLYYAWTIQIDFCYSIRRYISLLESVAKLCAMIFTICKINLYMLFGETYCISAQERIYNYFDMPSKYISFLVNFAKK